MTESPSEIYKERLGLRRKEAEELSRRFRTIGNLRLGAGIAAVLLAFFVFGPAAVHPLWLLAPLSALAVLIAMHARVVGALEGAKRAARFYEQGLARMENRWRGTGKQGERYRDPQHVYAEDLDLFGPGSLYELMCTARMRAGEDALADWLRAPAGVGVVRGRQEAVAELTPRLDLREELALLGEDVEAGLHPAMLARWGDAGAVGFPGWLRPVAVALSMATLGTLVGYLGGWWPRAPFLIALLTQLGVAYRFRPRVREVLEGVELPAQALGLLGQVLARIEREPCEAALLCGLRERLRTEGRPASAQIAQLSRLAEKYDWAHNEFFKPFAALMMWSTHVAISVERWRVRSGRAIPEWIRAAGEWEALCALASYRYERGSDPFPELVEEGPVFEGVGLAHPLVAGAVANDLTLGAGRPLWIVSGSNMSGKSTLLRTVGLNAVLAWAGAPVRAARLRISPLQVGASIRVQDSLQDGRSRFYAEITRLRQIVELTGRGLPVLFLLDELLSGTNSHDRRIGAEAIVRSLVERGAVGLLTTHDLALAHIAEANVHFEDELVGGRLAFDYRLRPGVVERSNALELMRAVGLEV